MPIFLVILILSILIIGGAFAGIGLKMIFKKNGEFKRQCSSVDPVTGQRVNCHCNKSIHDKCAKDKKYNPLDINAEMLKEIDS